MKAVAYRQNLPIDREESLLDIDLPDPEPGERDLLVEVCAVSVNPVDVKIRAHARPEPGQARVLGWDASGVVRAVGAKVTLFKPGDAVWYAGALNRPGTNSALHRVDERLVARKPATLGHADAAALPLTAITAWELLFDRLRVQHADPAQPQHLLVIGGAGGVGSILIQLARQLTGLTVIATASRPETREWVLRQGAHHVVDHTRPLASEIAALGLGPVQYVASLTHTDSHLAQIAELIAPQGALALIDDPAALDVVPFKRKSVSVHWEFMFTRSMFETADMAAQHRLLTRVADLVDAGVLRTTAARHGGTIGAANLRRAHALLESLSLIHI